MNHADVWGKSTPGSNSSTCKGLENITCEGESLGRKLLQQSKYKMLKDQTRVDGGGQTQDIF